MINFILSIKLKFISDLELRYLFHESVAKFEIELCFIVIIIIGYY